MTPPTHRETCGEGFDFFLHVTTVCARPPGHTGPHHPVRLAIDDKGTTHDHD